MSNTASDGRHSLTPHGVTTIGRLLLFNLRGTPPVLRKCFRVGTRVGFIEQESGAAMRAVALVPIGGADGN